MAPRGQAGYDFAAGSMGPKVEAVSRFVRATGRRAAIGALTDLSAVVDGSSGTQVSWAHASSGARS